MTSASRMIALLKPYLGACLLTGFLAGCGSMPTHPGGEQTFATHCASCHAIGRSGDSPLSTAPPFRSLNFRYPNEDLAEVLGKTHQVMPQFRELDGATILDLATYLQSIDQK